MVAPLRDKPRRPERLTGDTAIREGRYVSRWWLPSVMRRSVSRTAKAVRPLRWTSLRQADRGQVVGPSSVRGPVAIPMLPPPRAPTRSGCQRNAKMSPVSATPRCPLLSGQCVAAIMPGRLSGSVEAPLSRPGLEHRRPWGGTKGEERSGATRSHAQRVFQREHGEDGEHRTFPEVSTAWHSDGQPVGRAITRPRPALVVPR